MIVKELILELNISWYCNPGGIIITDNKNFLTDLKI
jgi:hypothetical protein